MRKLTLIAAFATAGVISAYAQTTPAPADETMPAPPAAAETMPAPPVAGDTVQTTETASTSNIAELAMADARFTTLVSAIQAADLAETLAGPGPYTVFAPTNDAFAALPDGKADKLMQPANKEKLTKVLSYHVVSGSIRSQDIAEGVTEVPTLSGEMLTVEKTADGVTVNGAKVVEADLQASNGYIHAIDAVVMADKNKARTN